MHPEFRRNGPYSNDISIIKVRSNSAAGISFNTHVKPICLPRYEQISTPGTWCSVTGWGAQVGKCCGTTHGILAINLPIHSHWFISRRLEELGSHFEGGRSAIARFKDVPNDRREWWTIAVDFRYYALRRLVYFRWLWRAATVTVVHFEFASDLFSLTCWILHSLSISSLACEWFFCCTQRLTSRRHRCL